MATRFVRVDLSDNARDFRPIAVEPGVPLLDTSNANARILFKWLGGLAAEPEWEGEAVNFYVRDDHGGRLENITCQPAGDVDLKGPLKDDLESLKERIARVHPETATERAVLKILTQNFNRLTEDKNRTDRDNYFFRYRDASGRWRLVWCWGYQRVDQQPAPTVICTDLDCSLLFVRRPGQSPKCPCCEAALLAKPVKRTPWKKAVLVGLLFFLIGGALVYWFLTRNQLVATPESWSGQLGSRIEFEVRTPGWFGFGSRDVSHEAVAVASDPRVVRLDPFDCAATAQSPGRAVIQFFLGNKSCSTTVTVGMASNPKSIAIEPDTVDLGVGTTAHLKLIGQFEDGSTVDLTERAEWLPSDDDIAFAHDGFLEGLREGTTTVAARYRASPEDDYLDASADVEVKQLDFERLELAVDPDPITVGRGSKLRIDAVTADGKSYSVLESSLLDLNVSPPYLATAQGTHIEGEHPGQGRLAAAFGDELTAEFPLDVVSGSRVDSLVVKPELLDLVVGEIADLNVLSPSRSPVRMTSSDPAVVELTSENRLVGRSEGTAEVEVRQAGEARSVVVTVTTANISSIALEPTRVVVPVDHTASVRVMGQVEGGRSVELAPDLISAQTTPSPRYADFNATSLAVHGVQPTDPSSPQKLALAYQSYLAEAPVEVVVAPLRLELTPAGPVDLPLGQMKSLDAWANYRGGHRVHVRADRLQWHQTPVAGDTAGLELRGNKVASLEVGAGPIEVWGTYLTRDSNRVAFRSVEAGPVALRIDVDRTLRLAGETGRLMLLGAGIEGDVELVPELAEFKGSDDFVLKVDETSGAFRAAAPGKVSITATHPAAADGASVGLRVVAPADARLVFEPQTVRVAVDEVAKLELFLEAQGDDVERARMAGPGVRYWLAQPDAVRWQAPALVGLRPTAPFEVEASYLPLLSSPAGAQVEVVAAEHPAALRIVPPEAALAPGQTLALTVEEQLPGSDRWQEVRPDAITWQIPDLIFTPATDGLRAAVTVPEGVRGRLELKAEHRGREASAALSVGQSQLSPGDPAVRLVLEREPEGRYLPVGRQQRYSIVLDKDNVSEPAANVLWPGDFENEYLRWEAPVLTAKQGGYGHWFQAEVGGRAVRFYTHTVDPSKPAVEPVPRDDLPVEVVILSDQGTSVQMPVGAEFDDFRVEAKYPDGFTRMVTKKAILHTPDDPSQSPVAFSEGRMIGLRPGKTKLEAAFDGVVAKNTLDVEVTAEVDVDEIRLTPAPVSILPGETITMEATGYKGGQSVGVLTGMAGLRWQSDNEQAVGVSGPLVTGNQLGQGTVTAQLGAVASQPAVVDVVASIADPLVIDQDVIRMRVGESRRIGTDVHVFRGQTDLSRQAYVTSSLPAVVQYVPETHSLRGMSPGTSAVTFSWADKLATTMVEVLPGGALEGDVVVEPAAGTLAVGQALDLRVFLVTKEGFRIDRTDSAVLTSTAPGNISIRGNKACALAPGSADVLVQLPESAQPATARVTVTNDPITDVVVDPTQVVMSVGDTTRLRILGQAAAGTHELFPQPSLNVTAGGSDPNAIQVVGSEFVNGVAQGNAEVTVSWANQLTRNVPITVTDDPITELTIDPAGATIHPGQMLVYQVTGMRGGRRRVLTAADGVQLFVGQPGIAQMADNTTVLGASPGRTNVVAQVGGQQTEATLNVVVGDGPAGSVAYAPGTDVLGPGYGQYGVGTDVIYGDGGRRIVRDGGRTVIYGPDGTVISDLGVSDIYAPPSGDVVALQFVPDVVRLATDSPGSPVQVVEVLSDGSLGRDISGDPALEFTLPPDVAAIERSAAGAVVRPVSPGETRVAAKLGTLLTQTPLLVQVGDLAAGGARLEVTPYMLELWPGETGTFQSVTVSPGAGQFPFDVDYRIAPTAGQGIVAVEGDRMIRALADGTAQVVVTAVDPSGAYNGLSTTATVRVSSASQLWMEPPSVSLQVGESTPPFAVMASGTDGLPYQVPATLDSSDPTILVPDPLTPGAFRAAGLGATQIRGVYRGREVLAEVTITGQRFVDVQTTLDEGQTDFSVTVEVLAAASEGPLQYRIYPAGQPPAENWIPSEAYGEYQRVVLESTRIAYGPRSARYHLVLEARDSAGSVQRYPFMFRLAPNIERTDVP